MTYIPATSSFYKRMRDKRAIISYHNYCSTAGRTSRRLIHVRPTPKSTHTKNTTQPTLTRACRSCRDVYKAAGTFLPAPSRAACTPPTPPHRRSLEAPAKSAPPRSEARIFRGRAGRTIGAVQTLPPQVSKNTIEEGGDWRGLGWVRLGWVR